ncbi:RNA-dependent RNA polymerase [Rhizoctonia solani]|uniref:RNA-dependent RNA polymerase n=1 Tax=Rhizoctonia solani TaxID=456999 RepID=A0A8H7INJ6_9AGAM|nr:RNA-dependent RNA polymerase [Rhizoctonia solani]
MDSPTSVQAVSFMALAPLAFVLLCYLPRWPTVRHPPSPMSFPLVGNLLSIPPGHEYIAFAKLGEELKSDMVFLKIFSQKIIVLNSTDVATEILDKRSAFHSDRPFIPMVADASLMNWSRVPSLIEYSDTWRQYRRIMGNWLNKRAVTQFNDMQEQQTRLLLRRLMGVTKHTRPFEHVKNEFFFATGSLMLQLAYGIGLGALKTHWFPWTRWKRTGKEWGVQQEKAKAMPYEWLKQQVANGSHQPSLLAPLVKDHEMLSNLTSSEKDELLKEVGIVLFAGGTDTVRSPNFVAAMILNPDVQEKAQRELDGCAWTHYLAEMSHKERLPYTRNLIEEVFRLYPLSHLEYLMHVTKMIATKAIILKKEQPCGAMGRDPRHYLDPETFDPDRYLDPQTPRAPRFGWGRRKCPGAHFAEASIFMIVASLLTTFTFSRKRTEDGQEIVPQMEAERDSMMLELKPFDFEIRNVHNPLARTQYKMAKAKKNETEAEGKVPERKGPAVIGINFGNAYASIAVINNEGEPDCIANEDGERQIAAALSYFGLEEYIGNQAKPQLVKNSQNTITNFRNQLGKNEVTQAGPSTSAPIIDHEDQPAYKVTILTPAPPPSAAPTPKATPLPTRLHRQFPKKKHSQRTIVNTGWNDAQRAALKRAAEEAGIKDASHALKSDDKTTLVVDLGAASLSLTLLSSKQGLYHTIGSSHSSTVGGDSIDDLLLTHFGKEFTKKTKVPVTLPCTSPGTPDQRADAKMRLAVEHTKRTISAGPGAAACAVESLKDGVDFSGTLNRLRFDMLVAKVYGTVVDEVKKLLDSAGVDPTLVDEVILVGGSAALPGLAERLEGLFGENTAVRSEIDPGQVLALGCALQAKHIISAQNDVFAQGVSAPVTSKILGLVFAGDDSAENWTSLVAAETPLPARRVLRFPVPAGQIGFEIWEGVDAVDVKKVAVEQDEDDEEEPEEEEIRTRIVKKDSALGGGVVDIKGKKGAKLLVQAIVSAEGKVDGNMERARVDSLVLPPATMAHVMKQKHGRPRHPRILRRTKNYQVFEQDIPRVYPFMLGYGGMGRIDLDAVANQPEATLGAETPPSSMSETLVEQVPEETDQVAMGVNSALVTSSVPQTLVPIQTTPIALLTSTPITFSVSVAVSATSTTTSSVPLAALITSSVAVSTSAPAPSSMVAAVTVLATSETTSSPFSPVSPSVVEIITSVSLVPSPSATSATQALKQKYPYALYVAFGLVILILLCAICASIAWVLRRRRKRKEAENDLWIGSVLNDEPDGKDGYELEKGVDEGGPGMAGDTPMPNNRNSTSGALYGFTPAHVRQPWRHSSLLQRGGPAAIDGVHHGLDGGGLTFRQDPNGGLTLDTRGIGPEGRVSYPNPHAALASAAPSHYSYGREGPFAVTNLMPGDISSRASETKPGWLDGDWESCQRQGLGDALRSGIYSAVGRIVGVEETKLAETKEAKSAEQEKDRFTELVQRRSHGSSNSPESSALAQSGSSPDAIKSGDARPIDWLEREPGQHMIPDSRGWIVEEFPGGSMGKIHIIATGARDRILRRLGSNSSVATWTTVYSTDTDPVFSSESATTTRANTIATSRRDTISTRRSGCVGMNRSRELSTTSSDWDTMNMAKALEMSLAGRPRDNEPGLTDTDRARKIAYDRFNQKSEQAYQQRETSDEDSDVGHPEQLDLNIPGKFQFGSSEPETICSDDDHSDSMNSDLIAQFEEVELGSEYGGESTECIGTQEGTASQVKSRPPDTAYEIPPDIHKVAFSPEHQKAFDKHGVSWAVQWECTNSTPAFRDTSQGESFADYYEKERSMRQPALTNPWEELDREETLIRDRDCGASIDNSGGKIKQRMRLDIVKSDACDFKFTLEQPTRSKSHRFSRFLGSRRLIECYISKNDVRKHTKIIIDFFSRKKLLINGRLFQAFFGQPGKVHLVEINQDFHRDSLPELGDDNRMAFLEFINCHNNLELNSNQGINKWATRFALGFSTSHPGLIFLPEDIHLLHDEYTTGKSKSTAATHEILTDGCGFLNYTALKVIEQKMAWGRFPTCIQARIAGSKGLFMLHPRHRDLSEQPQIWISYEMIMSLSENGVREELLVKMLRDTIGEEARSLEPSLRPHGSEVLYDSIYTTQRSHGLLDFDDEDGEEEGTALAKWDAGPDPFSGQPASAQEQVLGWLQAGFLPTDKFVMEKLVYLQKKTMEGLVKKYRIVVPHSVRAFIVPDPLGVLNEDEVFFASSQPIEASSSGFTQCITGPVLVSRNPCIQISDTRKVMAVNNYELWSRGYFDVIIFSVKGSRSLASLLSGGDYDGDTVVLIWDEQITSQFRNAHKRFADPGPGFESRNLIKSKKLLKDIKTRADSEGQDITKELISALLEDIAPSQLGMYNIFYRNSVYLFTQCLDSVKSGLKPKPEVLRADKQIWNKRQPDCFPSKTEEDGTYGSLLPLPRRGSSNRFILEVLQDVAKNEVESYEKKLGEMRDKCEISYRLDQDLIKPLKEAEARVRHPQFQQFQHELQIIVDHVRSFRTRYTESYGNRDKYSTQLPGRKHSKQGRSIAEGQGNIRAVSEAYSRTMPTGLLMFTDSEVRKIAAACAYRNCFCGKLNFCFAVAWSELCAIKAQASGGAFVTLTPGFVESMAIHRKMAKVFRDLERSEPNQVA